MLLFAVRSDVVFAVAYCWRSLTLGTCLVLEGTWRPVVNVMRAPENSKSASSDLELLECMRKTRKSEKKSVTLSSLAIAYGGLWG